MIALKKSNKSTYVTWLQLFDEGDGSRSRGGGLFGLLTLLVCVVEWPRGWPRPLCASYGHFDHVESQFELTLLHLVPYMLD